MRAVLDDVDKLAQAANASFARSDQRMDRFERRMDHLDHRMNNLEETVDNVQQTMATKDQMAMVLQIVESIDQKLKEYRTLPERVEQLERSVFRP